MKQNLKTSLPKALSVALLLSLSSIAIAAGGSKGSKSYGTEESTASGATTGQETTSGATQEQTGAATKEQAAMQESAAAGKPVAIKDVESLNDDLTKYNGKQVSVSGEVQDKMGTQSFVLESGGLINDEIVVLSSAKTKGAKVQALKDDSDVMVTGTVHTGSIADVRKQYGMELDPQIEAELAGARAFIVANDITPQKNK